MVARVSVSRGDLDRALRVVTSGLRARSGAEIRIEFQEGQFTIQGIGVSSSLPADGRWTGAAFVSGKALKTLVGHLPGGDVLTLEYKDDRLHIATLALPARWQDIASVPLPIPPNPSVADILEAQAKHGRGELVSSGLQKDAEAAEREVASRINDALRILGPLGIKRDDLHELLERVLNLKRGGGKGQPRVSLQGDACTVSWADVRPAAAGAFNYLSGHPELLWRGRSRSGHLPVVRFPVRTIPSCS